MQRHRFPVPLHFLFILFQSDTATNLRCAPCPATGHTYAPPPPVVQRRTPAPCYRRTKETA